jgi:hypothetical protein
MPQVSITINRPEVNVSTTTNGPTVTISETPVAITQNTSEIAVTTNPQVVQINTAATTIQTTTLDEAFKGEFSIDVTYHRGDLVRHEQAVYVYINTTPQQTNAPDVDTDLWVLLFSESGLTGPQVEGINRAINMKTWNPETTYSVGDIVMVRQDYNIDVGVTVPYFTLYRLYHASGSINVEPINHSSPPTIVDDQPVFDANSAWQNLSGVRSINGFSGDVNLQEILDAGSLALNATTFVQGSGENHGSFEAFADDVYLYGNNVYLGQSTSNQMVGFLLSNTGGGVVLALDNADGKLKFSYDFTTYYTLPTSTDDLAEGTTNKYYNDSLVDAHLSGGTGVTYTSGEISIGQPVGTTDSPTFNTVYTGVVRSPLNESVTLRAYNDTGAGTNYDLSVATTGQVNLPTGTTGQARIQSPDDISILADDKEYVFGTDGTLALPEYTLPAADGSANQVLTTNGSGVLTFATPSTSNVTEGTNLYYTDGRFDTRLATKTTTNLAEGTNLYYTTARANADFDTRLATKTTTNLAEGTNLYYTTARANSDFDTRLATKSTTNLAEGTNLYFTNTRARGAISGSTGITYNNTTGAISIDDTVVATHAYVGTQIANLVDSAPSTLDTLNELAAALGDDPNFATTITTALGNKLNTADFTSTANTWYATSDPIQNNTTDDLAEGTTNLYFTELRATNNFDNNLSLADTDDLGEGTTNKYYTDGRARLAISATGSIAYDSNTGVISYTEPTYDTDDIAEGTTNLYYTDARSRAAISATGDLSYNSTTGVISYSQAVDSVNGQTGVVVLDTDDVTEGSTNQYFTTTRSRNSISVTTTGQTAPLPSETLSYNPTTGVLTSRNPAASQIEGLINEVDLDQDAAGVYVKSLRNATRLWGGMEASTNPNYVFPAQTLSTVTDNNGYSAASSFPAGTVGHGANATFTHYYGDTLAGTNTSPAFNFRNANGNSSTGDIVPFTGLTSVAPSAISSGNVMGSLNFNGYATTDFSNDLATEIQGGGINALSSFQIQPYAAENFSDSVLTLTSTNVTAVASSFRAPLSGLSVLGTRGQIQYTGTQGGVGQVIRVTGTLTGTATGIVSGQNYYIIVYSNNGTNSFVTLSATPGGVPITTTAGTLTGLTLTRCGVTFTTTGLTNIPFGRGALVTVSGITNVTDGTYPVAGTPTTTSFILGIPHAVAPSVSGAQTFSCRTVYMGSGVRFRAFPLATPANLQNRLELLDMSPAATTIRTDGLTLVKGSYGNTGTALPGGDISYRRTFGCFHKMANVTAAAADTVYAFDWTTSTTAHVNTQGVTISNTSRIVFDNAGDYNVVIEMVGKNTDNADRTAYVWLAKNGTDLAETAIKLVLTKDTTTMLAKDWLVNGIADADYIEVRFAVDTTTSGISLEYTAAQTTPYARPAVASATITITPIGA